MKTALFIIPFIFISQMLFANVSYWFDQGNSNNRLAYNANEEGIRLRNSATYTLEVSTEEEYRAGLSKVKSKKKNIVSAIYRFQEAVSYGIMERDAWSNVMSATKNGSPDNNTARRAWNQAVSNIRIYESNRNEAKKIKAQIEEDIVKLQRQIDTFVEDRESKEREEKRKEEERQARIEQWNRDQKEKKLKAEEEFKVEMDNYLKNTTISGDYFHVPGYDQYQVWDLSKNEIIESFKDTLYIKSENTKGNILLFYQDHRDDIEKLMSVIIYHFNANNRVDATMVMTFNHLQIFHRQYKDINKKFNYIYSDQVEIDHFSVLYNRGNIHLQNSELNKYGLYFLGVTLYKPGQSNEVKSTAFDESFSSILEIFEARSKEQQEKLFKAQQKLHDDFIYSEDDLDSW